VALFVTRRSQRSAGRGLSGSRYARDAARRSPFSGSLARFLYGFAASFQTDPRFGRILAGYGGVFVAGSLAWGVVLDGFRPDRYDLIGASVCLVGVAIIMYSPR
jgi:drug/metabolite transporter superfamily protein YnfA